MHIVFSIDDLTDSFWPATAPVPSPESVPSPEQTTVDGMTRSHSEWAFQRLLREMSGSDQTNAIDRLSPPVQSLSTVDETADVVEIQKPPQNHQGVDADQYHAMLKSKLDLACDAAARRVGTEDSSASSSVNQNQSQGCHFSFWLLVLALSLYLSMLKSTLKGSVVAQTSPGASSLRSVPSTSIQKKLDVPARQATSISSRDDSDDDDLDGDAVIMEILLMMLSNRESARRSRRRKQEQMNEFDTQVGQLRGEHSTLLSRLSDMNHKCDAAAVDNRILRADIETLRTKVKMVEETVKRVTGVNPLHWARPNMGTPLNNTPSDSSRILPNSNHMLEPAIPSTTNAGLASNQRVERANLFPEQVNREGMPNHPKLNVFNAADVEIDNTKTEL
ncbi:hypothetical protein F2Q70_00026817 [Brassica cretica]|uniref:BZIP domain-containing protein n=1 Tax=Brassica cretica TaxID=69181 RepID=A0A8S9L315_BRACR|nr:hypothetical protein F2Q70_00026817 [Brassica cretica]